MKSPAFQWYAADYLADERVMLLSLESEAAYVRLLNYCWREGSIPSNPALCVPMCKYADVKVIKPALALFMKSPTQPGRLIHKRLEEERAKQEAFREKQAENGKRGGRPRKANDNPDETQTKGLGFSGETQTKAKKSSSSSTSSSNPSNEGRKEKALAPSPVGGKNEVWPEDAPTFLQANFFAFAKKIGYGHADLALYLPQIQLKAEKLNEQRDNEGWEEFIQRYFNNETKYDRLMLPMPGREEKPPINKMPDDPRSLWGYVETEPLVEEPPTLYVSAS